MTPTDDWSDMPYPKAVPMFVYRLKVKGNRPFPIDMLRYDRCIPASEGDATRIKDSVAFNEVKRDEPIEVIHIGVNKYYEPSPRWASFGYEVLSCVGSS